MEGTTTWIVARWVGDFCGEVADAFCAVPVLIPCGKTSRGDVQKSKLMATHFYGAILRWGRGVHLLDMIWASPHIFHT